MNDWNGLFDDRAYSYLATCHCTIRGFRDGNYNEEEEDEELEEIRDNIYIDDDEDIILLCRTYKFNVVKEYEDIYIEVRSSLDGELQMTIDAKKIILILGVPLKDDEWEKL